MVRQSSGIPDEPAETISDTIGRWGDDPTKPAIGYGFFIWVLHGVQLSNAWGWIHCTNPGLSFGLVCQHIITVKNWMKTKPQQKRCS